ERIVPFLPMRGLRRFGNASAGRQKKGEQRATRSRPPPVYFLRPIIAARAPITTSARTATMIVLVSRPAVTRGSTVPTRCSPTTARVSDVTVIQADVVAPAYPSFDTWIVTWTSVAPCALGAMTAALTLPARSVVPLPTWLPPIQKETLAPDTGAPSESVTLAI